jgi:hypothetical protein
VRLDAWLDTGRSSSQGAIPLLPCHARNRGQGQVAAFGGLSFVVLFEKLAVEQESAGGERRRALQSTARRVRSSPAPRPRRKPANYNIGVPSALTGSAAVLRGPSEVAVTAGV